MGSSRLSRDVLIGSSNGVWSGNSSTKQRARKYQDARSNSDTLIQNGGALGGPMKIATPTQAAVIGTVGFFAAVWVLL